jgi:predicted nucleotidyltransferase
MTANHRKNTHRKLDPDVLADIVARIVKVAKPEQIILFGSAARGQMGPHSDVDLLVVKSGRFNRGKPGPRHVPSLQSLVYGQVASA